MKRRNHWILFVVLLLSLTILSPSLDIGQNQKEEDRGDITDIFSTPAPKATHTTRTLFILVSMEQEEYSYFEQLVQDIAKEMNLVINLTNMEDVEFDVEFQNRYMMGESLDAALIDNRYITWYAKQGFARPMTGGDGGQAAVDSFDALLRAGEWNGYRWSIPMDIDPYVYAEYRTEDTSSEPLQSTSTFEEWESQLAAWSKQTEKPFYYDGKDPVAFASWLTFQGIIPEISQAFQIEDDIDQNQAEKLEEMKPIYTYLNTERNPFSSGKLEFQAGIITLSDLLPKYREELSSYINNDVNSQALAVKGRSFIVSPKSEQKEAILEFLAKLTSPESVKTWFTLSGKLPIYESMYTEPDMSDILNAVPLQALKESIEQSVLQDDLLTNPEKSRKAAVLIEQFIQGDVSFQEYRHHLELLSKPLGIQ